MSGETAGGSPAIEQSATYIQKVATFIAGLDEILDGGVPEGRTTLVSGGAGTGKTLLGMEFLYRGALAGEPGIFVTFEERADALRRNALALGWELAPLEKAGALFLFEARLDLQAVLAGDFNLQGLLAILSGQIRKMGCRRMVIDAIDVLIRIFENPARERNELHTLHEWFLDQGLTTVLTTKASSNWENVSRYDFLDYMSDCVIRLDQRVVGHVATRRLRVVKYRGSGFGSNEYPYVITNRGISLIPISRFGLQHMVSEDLLSTGNRTLDAVLGGGYRRGSCILISGSSGIGKTTIASTISLAACRRGERVLYINFEESEEAMQISMRSAGIDLGPALEAGTLRILTTIPEAMGGEEHLIRAFNAIEVLNPELVILDAISATLRMGSEKAAFDYMMRLVNACREKGITIILNNQSGIDRPEDITGIGFSSLVDSIILMHYFETDGRMRRMLRTLKSRGMKHSNRRHELFITDRGIEVGDIMPQKAESIREKSSETNGTAE